MLLLASFKFNLLLLSSCSLNSKLSQLWKYFIYLFVHTYVHTLDSQLATYVVILQLSVSFIWIMVRVGITHVCIMKPSFILYALINTIVHAYEERWVMGYYSIILFSRLLSILNRLWWLSEFIDIVEVLVGPRSDTEWIDLYKSQDLWHPNPGILGLQFLRDHKTSQ